MNLAPVRFYQRLIFWADPLESAIALLAAAAQKVRFATCRPEPQSGPTAYRWQWLGGHILVHLELGRTPAHLGLEEMAVLVESLDTDEEESGTILLVTNHVPPPPLLALVDEDAAIEVAQIETAPELYQTIASLQARTHLAAEAMQKEQMSLALGRFAERTGNVEHLGKLWDLWRQVPLEVYRHGRSYPAAIPAGLSLQAGDSDASRLEQAILLVGGVLNYAWDKRADPDQATKRLGREMQRAGFPESWLSAMVSELQELLAANQELREGT